MGVISDIFSERTKVSNFSRYRDKRKQMANELNVSPFDDHDHQTF